MNAPGAVTHWFDIEAEHARGDRSQFVMRIVGAVLLVMFLVPGVIVGVTSSDGSTGSVVGSVIIVAVVLGGFAVGIFLTKRSRKRTRVAARVRQLGVGPAGLSYVTDTGTHNMSWDRCHGVRVHSAVRNLWAGRSATDDYSLDLLGQLPYPPANPGQAATASPLLSRIALPEGVGLNKGIARGFAEQVGHAVWKIRPDKWRGFTHNSGIGGDEFQSWGSAISDTLGIGPTPTAGNFGSRFQPPPPGHQGRRM